MATRKDDAPGAAPAARRLAPEARRAQLLGAARDVLAREGVEGFSLEQVARQAGVAATLPRHYFVSAERLLVEAVTDVVDRGIAPLLGGGDVDERLDRYVVLLTRAPWIHAIWMHSAAVHPEIDAMVRDRRRQLIARAYGRGWSRLRRDERMRGIGWLGACDAILAEWIAAGARSPKVLLDHLVDASRRFGLGVG